jgi:thiopeptide-type bacteriocin biosynthesis protein
MNNYTWVYYKIGFGIRHEMVDAFIRSVLPQAAALVDAERWFFIRYIDDSDGLHLRFRALVQTAAQADAVTALSAFFNGKVQTIHTLPPSGYQEMVALGPFRYDARFIGVREEEYQPEYEKFGGPLGMQDAEEWFHASSEVAVAVLEQEVSKGISRKTVAPMLMAEVLDILVPDPRTFLEHYSHGWLTPDVVQRRMLRDEFFDKASELMSAGLAIVETADQQSPGTREAIAAWRLAVHTANVKFEQYYHVEPLFALHQAWQMIHLMNNRLGFSPLEEAYLATLLEAYYAIERRHAA